MPRKKTAVVPIKPKKGPVVIRLPKVKERGIMPKPAKAIPDPKKEAERKACRKKVTPEEEGT